MGRWRSACLLLVVLGNLAFFPMQAVAQTGLVPDCKYGEENCGTEAYSPDNYGVCELVETFNNVLQFLLGMSVIIIALVIVYIGFIFITSRGNAATIEQAKGMFTKAIGGFVIMLVAFLVVNTVMNVFMGGTNDVSEWSVVDCAYSRQAGDAKFEITAIDNPVDALQFATSSDVLIISNGGVYGGMGGDILGGNIASDGASCTPGGLQVGDACYAPNRCTAGAANVVNQAVCNNVNAFDSHIRAASARRGVPVSLIKSIMAIESGGRPNLLGPSTKYGRAIGLMQVMPATGRESCGKGSQSQLLGASNVASNIDCGAAYLAKSYRAAGGNASLAAAGYNGGIGVLTEPSRDCPGLMVWQCPFNSGGCCSNNKVVKTGCSLNDGFSSYRQTREYVDRALYAAATCGW